MSGSRDIKEIVALCDEARSVSLLMLLKNYIKKKQQLNTKVSSMKKKLMGCKLPFRFIATESNSNQSPRRNVVSG